VLGFDVFTQRRDDRREGRGGLLFQVADSARTEGNAEQVGTQRLGLILAQAVGAGQYGQGGLQARPLLAGGHAGWQRGAGRRAATRANQAVQLVFADEGLDRG
jgi:hypothetical protein